MKKSKYQIVEPSDTSSGLSDAIALYEHAGWALADAQWLGQLSYSQFRGDRPNDYPLDEIDKRDFGIVADSTKYAAGRGDRNFALFVAFARLCGYGGEKARLSQRATSEEQTQTHSLSRGRSFDVCERIAKVFFTPGPEIKGANFEAALIAGGWPGDYADDDGHIMEYVRGDLGCSFYRYPEIVQLMRMLVETAGLKLETVLDEVALVATGVQRAMLDGKFQLRVPKPVNLSRPPMKNCRLLTTWLIGLGPQALAKSFPLFEKVPNVELLAAMAVGVQDAIERWLWCGTHHWTYFAAGGYQLAGACSGYLNLLRNRSVNDQSGNVQLKRSWLWFARCVYSANGNLWQELTPDRREEVLRAANEDLSKLRPLFARARLKKADCAESGEGSGHLTPGDVRAPWEEFKCVQTHFETCVILLYKFGGVWRGMKPLLLAIRSMGCPCVARDLRYWNEVMETHSPASQGVLEQPPEPWFVVPASMINLFHSFVAYEQSSDEQLTALRGELARFCLERLVDRWKKDEREAAEKAGRKRTDEDMQERSSVWRYCLVRAVSSLHIDPEGKGHRILEASSRIDPDEDVREVANATYQQMRRQTSLPEGVSPRRAIMSALWWIRQAHLLGLEVELDANGAQRTRAKELTRTKEIERDHKLAMRSM